MTKQQPQQPNQAKRRTFVKGIIASLSAPYFVPSRCFGASDRVSLGFVGLRNQGMSNIKGFLGQKQADLVAVCDVDKKVMGDATKFLESKGKKVATHGDYRELLERKDIDAVVATVPDHWHALMTIHACQAGKDVYCEKPLSLTIAEGRKMVDVARANHRIVQTGSQQRSDTRFRTACELVRNGHIGKLEKVLVGIPKVNFSGPPVADTDPPAVLDYNFWLGPAPQRPYNEKRVHYLFRFFWDYSGGQMTNFGAHHLDIAQWALGMDESGPVEIEGSAEYHPEKWFEVPSRCRVTYKYANGASIILGQDQKDVPDACTFVGEKGSIYVNRSKITSTLPDIVKPNFDVGAIRLYASKNHHTNFLDCVKSRKLPVADVEIGHRSATVCHLGNIAARLGRKLVWDPRGEKFPEDSEAQAMTSRPYRAPWTI